MIFVTSKTSDGNMDFRFGDAKKVLENRKKFLEKLNINSERIVEVTQVHGNKIHVIDTIPDSTSEADGIMTNQEDVYLMMKLADCMAIGFYDPKQKAIGLAHAGFRGLGNKIIKKCIEAMKQNFGTSPQSLKVKISPSIGPCHYRIDLWADAEKQLVKCGVSKENINNPKICTYENVDYFSHRKSEDLAEIEGRFVTILGL